MTALVGADEAREEGEHLVEELGIGLAVLEEVAEVLDAREEVLLGLELVVDLLLEGEGPVADDEGVDGVGRVAEDGVGLEDFAGLGAPGVPLARR